MPIIAKYILNCGYIVAIDKAVIIGNTLCGNAIVREFCIQTLKFNKTFFTSLVVKKFAVNIFFIINLFLVYYIIKN
ncbi:hypothetical protein SDC9_168193 [bioreactor metagenome]|uniref:Uncharacterized protein n=1 Tax=bioreactor metagenome TaxID=1076179 RepID=A0A645G9R8_9ZZZZ